jgi:hypothetical protein
MSKAPEPNDNELIKSFIVFNFAVYYSGQRHASAAGEERK